MQKKAGLSRERAALGLILLLAAFLTCWRIWEEGYGNQYYTAAVKSMLTSWRNFFFVSFDKGGFISVDKPPLGLWLQCLFAAVFGVKGWSVILPEALCYVGSVAVLHRIMRRGFGEACALAAALILAVTPIFVAASRTNNLDAPLTLVCLLALWAAISASERGSLKLLLLSAALIGLGFNVKMLQAYMFLPAVYLVYLFSAEARPIKRIAHLAAATALLLAVSLSWCLAVDLTPASNRPFVGSSTSNSTLELAIGYNGILRALPFDIGALRGIGGAIGLVPNEGGSPGILRMFNREMAGQIGWFLPLSLFGLAALAVKSARGAGEEKKRAKRQLLAWAGVFVPMFAYFSASGHIHRYYLIMFAPCVAALSAVALSEFLKFHLEARQDRGGRWKLALLPLALASTAAVQLLMLLGHYSRYSKALAPIAVAGTAAAAALLILRALLGGRKAGLLLAAAVCSISLCAAPLFWALSPAIYGTNVVTPYAGPPDVSSPTNDGRPVAVKDSWEKKWFEGADFSGELIPDKAVGYMLEHDNGARFLVAVPNVMFATPIILEHGASVMALGGFTGADRAIDLEHFKALVERGELQYFCVMEFMEGTEITEYVRTHGRKVDPREYFGRSLPFQFISLYDLSGLKQG